MVCHGPLGCKGSKATAGRQGAELALQAPRTSIPTTDWGILRVSPPRQTSPSLVTCSHPMFQSNTPGDVTYRAKLSQGSEFELRLDQRLSNHSKGWFSQDCGSKQQMSLWGQMLFGNPSPTPMGTRSHQGELTAMAKTTQRCEILGDVQVLGPAWIPSFFSVRPFVPIVIVTMPSWPLGYEMGSIFTSGS